MGGHSSEGRGGMDTVLKGEGRETCLDRGEDTLQINERGRSTQVRGKRGEGGKYTLAQIE